MKQYKKFLAWLLVLGLLPMAAGAREGISGRWTGQQGEEFHQLILAEEGLYLYVLGTEASISAKAGTWEEEENVLRLLGEDGGETRFEIQRSGDLLKLKPEDGEWLELTREVLPVSPDLVGTWEGGDQETLVLNVEEDGHFSAYNSVYYQTVYGLLAQRKDLLFLALPVGSPVDVPRSLRFSLTGDELRLEDLKLKKTVAMTRVPGVQREAVNPAYETDGLPLFAGGFSGYAPYPQPVLPYGYNTDEYAHIEEHGYRSVLTSPLSTFAADVDTASWANVRRMLLKGEMPPADAVRIEEMINYFRYDYPAPREGEPFSVTTQIAPCPWNPQAKLLLVGLQARDLAKTRRPDSNLVFLIDVSGSMEGPDRLGLAQQAFMMLIEQLQDGDRVSIVTYAGSDRVVLVGSSDKKEIMGAIEGLFASGYTAGGQGIQTAYRIAQEQFIPGGNNRVILATDGDFNVGVSSEGELTRLIEEKKKSGVFLSVLGFGYGNYKDNKLESLADHGNGHFAYIDSVLEARRALVDEMGGLLYTVAKDVKFQIEFNPERIVRYRQVGYENRQMASEDFADDTKDGGEVGAGHRVTVLYEIFEKTEGEEADAGLKYQQTATTGSREYLTVSIRAKEPDADESRLYTYPVGEESVVETMTENLLFASAVAQTGMLLRQSPYAGTATYAAVAAQLDKIPNLREDPWKDEFAFLVRRLARQSED